MKKTILFLSLLLLVALGVIAYMGSQLNYDKETTETSLPRNNNKTIDAIFIGNSIVQMWDDYNSTFMTKNNFLNKGIGGQTSSDILLRFRNDVIDNNPTVVVLSIGINDIAENSGEYKPQLTVNNIMNMAELAKHNNIEVLITSVLPANNFYWRPSVENIAQKIIDLNKTVETFAKEKGYTYVDYYSSFVNDSLGIKHQYHTDGVHLNKEGYQVLEEIIKPQIEKKTQDKNKK